MRAKVTIYREAGEQRTPARRMQGDLLMKHEQLPGEDRTVPVLRLLRHPEEVLYDPKLVRICAGTMVLAGLEKIDRAWHAQVWSCDVFD